MKPFVLPAVLLLFFGGTAYSKPQPKGGPTLIYSSVLEFAERELDAAALELLQIKSLTQRPTDWIVIQQVFDHQVRSRSRTRLLAMVRLLAGANKCQDRQASKLCAELERRWTGYLADLLFFEDSAPKIERSRRLLEAKDCAGAATVLKGVESREGLVLSVEHGLRKALVCLGDARGLDELEQRALQVKVF